MPAQPQALGKSAFWEQLNVGMSMNGAGDGSARGYLHAVRWAGKIMGTHAVGGDAIEGMRAFLNKEKPKFVS
jgi:hypothetical protein